MKKINFWLDVVSLLVLLALTGTGIIMKWILPPGTGGRHHEHSENVKYLLGWGRHDWGDLHFILAAAFILLMLLHLVLHWGWIKSVITNKNNTKGE